MTTRIFLSSSRFLAVFLVGWCSAVAAQHTDGDWPQFRGPSGSGTSDEKGLPTTWSATENIVWRTPLPGHGASSPIIVGNRVFLTCFSGFGLDEKNPGEKTDLRQHVICVDRRNGRVTWNREFKGKELPKYGAFGKFTALHGFASSTPVSDGKTVYAFFGHAGVVAFDMAGQRLWVADVGSKTHGFGTGASPILYENLLIVNASVESGSLVALDKRSGKEVWRAEGIKDAWNTPVLVKAKDGRQELVIDTKDKLRAFDPQNGQALWHCAGSKSPRYICPSPVANDGILYALHGYFGPFTAIRAGGQGDAGESHRLWRTTEKGCGSNVSSP
ncbi:MAG: PQQ-binding-like beta-propeller repeat protein, partial [Lentisphaeria bacterium]|nr:PQQ-binding-like beta-propeller repeat protein [Lentisphaeria bacterium]